jgi:hypothetical protein
VWNRCAFFRGSVPLSVQKYIKIIGFLVGWEIIASKDYIAWMGGELYFEDMGQDS